MTEHDLARIEETLGIRMPPDYSRFILSKWSHQVPGLFLDADQIISENLRRRTKSWLGRPLESVFFVFALDRAGNEVFFDLDIPKTPVFVAEHAKRNCRVQAKSFEVWLLKQADSE